MSDESFPQEAQPDVLTGRCYTHARRFPLVIGKLQGFSLPGGPYTITQVGMFIGALLVLILTRGLWARFPGVINLVIMVGLPYGLAWAARHARVEGRDPFRAALGLLTYFPAARSGRLHGHAYRSPRPAHMTGRLFVSHFLPLAVQSPISQPARYAIQGPVASPRPATPRLSGARRNGAQFNGSAPRPALAPTHLQALLRTARASDPTYDGPE